MTSEQAAPSAKAVRYVGPSGWSYPDWNGVFYPPGRTKTFDALAYVARYFTAVEVNASFYRPIPPKMSASWVRRVDGHDPFKFAFKLHQSFTHDRADYSAGDIGRYCEGITPVADASRLGCVLMQFPWSFRRTPQSVDWIRRLAGDFGRFPVAIELRHASWDTPETIATLSSLGVGYCNVDQPALANCVGPSQHATGDVGYVRFHGRRTDVWFSRDVASYERYNYTYAPEELRAWVPRVRAIEQDCEEVYVFCNNHYRGQAPANALQLRSMLEERPVRVPDQLLACFPQLEVIRANVAGEFRETLF